MTVRASGLSSTGRRPSASATPNGRPDLAPGRQHREAAEELHQRQIRSPAAGSWTSRASPSSPHAPSSTAPASAPLPARNRRRETRSERVGGHRSEPILRPMAARSQPPGLSLVVDGQPVEVADDGASLLEVLRDRRSATGPRRTAAARRASAGAARCWSTGSRGSRASRRRGGSPGRAITTVDGLARRVRDAVGGRVLRHRAPASAGSARPGIVCRLEGLRAKAAGRRSRRRRAGAPRPPLPVHRVAHDPRRLGRRRGIGRAVPDRDLDAASARAALETRRPAGAWRPAVALGQGGFADDTAPPDALVAVPDGAGRLGGGRPRSPRRGRSPARCRAGAPRSTPRLRSTSRRATGRPRCARRWVEPAYLEPDASWCEPGGEPRTPLANGGAFGGKLALARQRAPPASLADEHGRPVRVLLDREDVVRLGPKRPPVAGGADADGPRRAAGRAHAGHRGGDRLGGARPRRRGGRRRRARRPRRDLRAAGWAEATVLLAGARGADGPVTDPVTRRRRRGRGRRDGTIRVRVDAGEPARRGRAALLRHRRRPHGAVLGQPRGDRGRRRRRRSTTSRSAPSACCGPSTRRRSRSRSSPSAGRGRARRRRRVRRRGGRRLAATSAARPTGRPAPAGADRLRAMSKPVGPYTPIVRAGEWLVVSGQVGIADGKLVTGGLEGELRQAIANLAGPARGRGRDRWPTSPRPPCSSSTSAATTPA